MEMKDIKKDLPVVYVPEHLLGAREINDNQLGIVSSMNDTYVFVRYRCTNTPQATRPDDLYPLHNRPDLMVRLGIEITPINRICEMWIEDHKKENKNEFDIL